MTDTVTGSSSYKELTKELVNLLNTLLICHTFFFSSVLRYNHKVPDNLGQRSSILRFGVIDLLISTMKYVPYCNMALWAIKVLPLICYI